MSAVSKSRFSAPPSRILALWLPTLATDRAERGQAEREQAEQERAERGLPGHGPLPASAGPDRAPLVAVARIANALRLTAVNGAAAGAGLRAGLALADARAMYPDLRVIEADARADAAMLERIGRWCERYTPLVSVADTGCADTGCADAGHADRGGVGGLFLDISGCAHLFGGEAGLADDLLIRLARAGFAACVAVAPTAGAAWALARYGSGNGGRFASERDLADALASLPLAALRLDAETVAGLNRTGLKRIGQLAGAARAPLASRFGKRVLERLDQATGQRGESLSPLRPVADFSAERRFPEPLALHESIAACLESLSRRLGGALEEHGLGVRHLRLTLFGVDGHSLDVEAGTSRPLCQPRQMAELIHERLAAADPGLVPEAGFDVVRLAAIRTAPLRACQTGMGEIGNGPDHAADLARLVDRLGARFGLRKVVRFAPRDSHVPELAVAPLAAPGEGGNGRLCWQADPVAEAEDMPSRPLRLLARPEPVEAIAEVPDGPPLRFRWRNRSHRVVHAEGPERIAGEWWRSGTAVPTRDYYRVEEETGQRFWLYREGIYGRETAAPRWFMHGLFG